MPLEIRELVIKANMGSNETQGAQGNAATDNQQDKNQAMVQTCVEAVLEILKQQNER